jgi:dipeptide/tripeptide permease
MLVYCLPVLFGWVADVYTGRWRMIIWGVYICGIAHIIILASGTPSLLQAGHAAAPFMIGLYVLAFGAGKMSIPALRVILLTRD